VGEGLADHGATCEDTIRIAAGGQFWRGPDDTSIYEVALAGGSPQKLCDIGNSGSFDAACAPDGESVL